MADSKVTPISKWPFLLADALLLAGAYYIYYQGPMPLGVGQLAVGAGCVGLGGALSLLPWIIDHRASVKLAENGQLTTAMEQLRKLEGIASQISGATNHWQLAQEQAEKVVASAQAISERMSAEVKGFSEFMQRTNDTEKNNLRLEVDKLRRAEGDWLQTCVRILDHVNALYAGAVRSGQSNVIEQVGNFQRACHEATRRIGLGAFIAREAEPFDPQKHQLADPDAKPPEGSVVKEVIAAGYTFQGRLLRRVLVNIAPAANPPAAQGDKAQMELPAGGA